MRSDRTPWWLIVALIAALAVAAALIGACAKHQPDIPSRDPLPCSSHLGWDNRWYDSDGEVVDEDPCDGVDSPKPSKTPAVKVSPPKKSTAPAPRVTRR